MLDKTNIKTEEHFYFQYSQLFEKRSFYETRLLTGKRKPYYEG